MMPCRCCCEARSKERPEGPLMAGSRLAGLHITAKATLRRAGACSTATSCEEQADSLSACLKNDVGIKAKAKNRKAVWLMLDFTTLSL